MRRMVLRRGVGSYPVFGAYCKMFSRGVSLVSEDIHTFHSKELLGVHCHGREGVGVVHATGIVVHEKLVLCIAACLHVVAHVDDISVQDHGPCVGIGKADLALATFLQLFFYVAESLFFRFLVRNLRLDFLFADIPILLIELVLVLLDLVIDVGDMAVYLLLVEVVLLGVLRPDLEEALAMVVPSIRSQSFSRPTKCLKASLNAVALSFLN